MKSLAVLAPDGGDQLPFCLVTFSDVHAPHKVEVPSSALVDLMLSRLAIFNDGDRAGHVDLQIGVLLPFLRHALLALLFEVGFHTLQVLTR